MVRNEPPGARLVAASPSEPWRSFLTELDTALAGPADFHCIGGFVVSQHYGFARETADLDVLTVIPPEAAQRVVELAGRGSPLHRSPHAQDVGGRLLAGERYRSAFGLTALSRVSRVSCVR